MNRLFAIYVFIAATFVLSSAAQAEAKVKVGDSEQVFKSELTLLNTANNSLKILFFDHELSEAEKAAVLKEQQDPPIFGTPHLAPPADFQATLYFATGADTASPSTLNNIGVAFLQRPNGPFKLGSKLERFSHGFSQGIRDKFQSEVTSLSGNLKISGPIKLNYKSQGITPKNINCDWEIGVETKIAAAINRPPLKVG